MEKKYGNDITFTYGFTPTGIGTEVVIIDKPKCTENSVSKIVKNVTDLSSW